MANPKLVLELDLLISKAINWAILAFKMAPKVSSLTPILMPLTVLLTLLRVCTSAMNSRTSELLLRITSLAPVLNTPPVC